MTLSEFKKKSLGRQLELALKKGKLVNGVTHKKNFFRLLSMGDFYVEIKHDPKDKRIVDFKLIKKSKELQKYVERFADIYQEASKKLNDYPDLYF